ncbi:MAG: hypothetical protein QOI11_3457 [Candidatus Eremiobacteraeota bacterium]|jgi:hypothetical protein|nr:hypothetical protein [Candidatus Eremiobacteraeota bacterium]
MKLVLSAAALGSALVLGATAQSPAPSSPAPAARKMPTQFKLAPQNGSGEAGTATLLDGAGGLIVRLRLSNASGDQPAHIHKGTCEKLGGVVYPLKAPHDGFSETTVPKVTTAELAGGTYAINVHKSATDLGTYVSCGNFAKAK